MARAVPSATLLRQSRAKLGTARAVRGWARQGRSRTVLGKGKAKQGDAKAVPSTTLLRQSFAQPGKGRGVAEPGKGKA